MKNQPNMLSIKIKGKYYPICTFGIGKRDLYIHFPLFGTGKYCVKKVLVPYPRGTIDILNGGKLITPKSLTPHPYGFHFSYHKTGLMQYVIPSDSKTERIRLQGPSLLTINENTLLCCFDLWNISKLPPIDHKSELTFSHFSLQYPFRVSCFYIPKGETKSSVNTKRIWTKDHSGQIRFSIQPIPKLDEPMYDQCPTTLIFLTQLVNQETIACMYPIL